MENKQWFRSREVWVLGVAVLLGLSHYFGIDFEGIVEDASGVWVGFAPIVALVLRLFFTNSKLTT